MTPRSNLGRHPGDVLRLAFAVAIFAGLVVVARSTTVTASEADAFRVLNDLPRIVTVFAYPLLGVASVPAVVFGVLVALLARRLRLAIDLVGATAAAYGAAHLLAPLGRRAGPAAFTHVLGSRTVLEVWPGFIQGTGFPSPTTAVVAAAASVIGPYVPRPARRIAWAAAGGVALAELYAGLALPADVIGGLALGWAVGALINLAFGAPVGHPDIDDVHQLLSELGLTVRSLEALGAGVESDLLFSADTGDRTLLVRVLGRDERSADLLLRAWRYAVFRGVEDSIGLSSRHWRAEHEAFMTVLAGRTGARVPAVISAGSSRTGLAAIVEERIPGRRLDAMTADEIDDEMLVQLWRQVRLLHDGRIAHGRLRRHSVVVDTTGEAHLIDLSSARAGADPERLARDVAELLVSLAVVVGAHRAVTAAVEGYGADRLVDAAPFLQHLALSTPTVVELFPPHGLLREVRDAVAEAADIDLPPFAQVTRVHPRTVVVLVVLGFGVNLLLPQVGTLQTTFDVIRHGHWWWLAAGGLATAATWVAAALSQMGAVERRLPLRRTTGVQIASCFTNRVTPAGTGGLGLNEQYLERQGLERAEAINAVGINVLGGAIVHTIGVFIALAALGESGVGGVPLPEGWVLLVAIVAVLALLGIAIVTPLGRWLRTPARNAARDIARVARRPRQSLQLFGGSAGVTLFNAMALMASLAAFGVSVDVGRVALVYLGGSAVASVSPTPGQLGAVEAALVAGLTGIGVAAAPAVAGVLAFRLLTFWLPTLPGIVAFRWLRRRQYV